MKFFVKLKSAIQIPSVNESQMYRKTVQETNTKVQFRKTESTCEKNI